VIVRLGIVTPRSANASFEREHKRCAAWSHNGYSTAHRFGYTLELEGETHILRDAHVRVAGIVLNHRRDAAILGRLPGHVLATIPDLTAR